MARKLRMLAPFDSASGNLSGAQKLLYAKNNNPSWEAPVGSNAARNYKTRYIGVYRAATGSSTFAVRTKNIASNSEKMRQLQAIFGGSSVCFIAASRNLTILTKLQAAFDSERESQPNLTFRKWLSDFMYYMLENKLSMVSISTPLGIVSINNPWVEGGSGVDLQGISADTIAKFFMYLANDAVRRPVTPVFGGKVKYIVGHQGETFAQIIASNHNNLNLSVAQGSTIANAVKIGQYFLCAPEEDVKIQMLSVETLDARASYIESIEEGETEG